MSYSTFLVLLFLTFGQVLILGIGFLVLWLAGEFEEGNGRTGSPSRLHPPYRWPLRMRLSARKLRRRLRSATTIVRRFSYSRVIVTSFFAAAAVASVLVMMKVSTDRSDTASVTLLGLRDGANRR
jgi:hypothetical protein